MAVDADATGQLSETELDRGEAGDRDVAEVGDLRRTRSAPRQAVAVGLLVVVALTALLGWFSQRAYDANRTTQQRRVFLQVGRQAALNLTNIDCAHVDADVARILDSATGSFHDEFQRRVTPFIDVVKKARSRSEGTVAEAALESLHGDQAQVLVAVQVRTSVPGVPDQGSKGWRMRIDLRKKGADIKVSDVTFVI